MIEKYRTPKPNEMIKIKRYLDDMTQCSIFLKNTFIGKRVFFCTDTNKVSVTFLTSNYMHLCGFKYDKGAGSFFNDCYNKTLDISKLNIKKDGTTFLKLNILNAFPLLVKENCSLTGQG
ncbi:PBECR4 domain-containing protein, partial [Lactiplantibacillus plantarum]